MDWIGWALGRGEDDADQMEDRATQTVTGVVTEELEEESATMGRELWKTEPVIGRKAVENPVEPGRLVEKPGNITPVEETWMGRMETTALERIDVSGIGDVGRNNAPKGNWTSNGLLAMERANLLAVGANAYRVREVTATPLTMTSGRGSGISAAELDRLVQRDARRYDGGFALY